MKRTGAAVAVRVHRNAASESNWQEWISGPAVTRSIPANGSQLTPVNGEGHPPHEAIALLAYGIWEKRGRPFGSAEEDWFRAETQLLQQ